MSDLLCVGSTSRKRLPFAALDGRGLQVVVLHESKQIGQSQSGE